MASSIVLPILLSAQDKFLNGQCHFSLTCLQTLMFSAIYVFSFFSLERSVVYQKLKVGHLDQQKGALGIVALSSFEIAGGLSELLGAHGIDLNLNH